MKGRRKAREIVLETLYRMEIAKDSPEEILPDIFRRENLPVGVRQFSERLIKKIVEKSREIDETIEKVVKNWKISRIATIDRNILRLSICEILYLDNIPVKVSVDEAIEIAKKFSTENSGRFVNGVLDRVLQDFKSNIGFCKSNRKMRQDNKTS
jgi:N utilization substance protein B